MVCKLIATSFASRSLHRPVSRISATLVILVLILPPMLIVAADIHTPPPNTLTQVPISESRAFASFFNATARLDRRAQEVERAGNSSQGLRNGMAAALGVSTTEYAAVLAVARKVGQRTAALDARAKEIIERVRSEHATKNRTAGVPPPPAELARLQGQRDAIVSDGISELQLTLGDKSFTVVKAYLHKKMGTLSRLVSPD